MTGARWFDVAKGRADVRTVAEALGCAVVGRSFGPCPACNEGRRRADDRRPPVGFGRDGWCCFRGSCGARGDVIDLVALRLFGRRAGELRGDRDRKAELRAWFADRGWCDPAEGSTAKAPAVPPTRPVEPRAEVAPVFLPSAEVHALWAACVPVAGRELVDPVTARTRRAAREWLEGVRGLSAELVSAADLARVLPGEYPWPPWVPSVVREVPDEGPAAGMRPYALAVPLVDELGELRALRFRAVDRVRVSGADGGPPAWTATAIERGRKAIASRSGRGRYRVAAGLVMADPMALALLRGAAEVDGVPWSGLAVVLEGEPAWWAMATHPDRLRAGADGRPSTYATFGIESGAWTPAIAARLPDGARVRVWTDFDVNGDRYFEAVRASLAGRVDVRRVKRPSQWGTDA